VPGSFPGRYPDNLNPYTNLEWFYSDTYAQQLFEAACDLYLYTAGIGPDTAEGERLIAKYVAVRMGAIE
jgi:hypothetical protein